MSIQSIGDVPIPDNEPYSEMVKLTHPSAPERSPRCSVCGSPHQTHYRHVVNHNEGDGIISGDLKMRNIIIYRCMSCGHSAPLFFSMIRNI